ncbi:MAG: hypothetical protein OHK0039_31330 [Bacteroidia bacterium]
MIHGLLLASLMLCYAPARAQAGQTPLFEESFDDNSRNWPLSSIRQIDAQIEGGMYVLEGRTQATGFLFSQPLPIRVQGDFDLELAVTQRSGARNMGYGLVWGATEDERDLFSMLISSNGQYTLLRKERGLYEEIKRWTATKLIRRPGEPNLLRVSRRDSVLSYYLNDRKIFAYADEHWRGNRIGIILHGTMRLEVDYLRLTSFDADFVHTRD